MGFFIYCNTFSSSFELNISFRHFQNNKLKRKNTSLGGARTHESIISSGQKFFVRFLVQVKIVESPFEINWPLENLHQTCSAICTFEQFSDIHETIGFSSWNLGGLTLDIDLQWKNVNLHKANLEKSISWISKSLNLSCNMAMK